MDFYPAKLEKIIKQNFLDFRLWINIYILCIRNNRKPRYWSKPRIFFKVLTLEAPSTNCWTTNAQCLNAWKFSRTGQALSIICEYTPEKSHMGANFAKRDLLQMGTEKITKSAITIKNTFSAWTVGWDSWNCCRWRATWRIVSRANQNKLKMKFEPKTEKLLPMILYFLGISEI